MLPFLGCMQVAGMTHDAWTIFDLFWRREQWIFSEHRFEYETEYTFTSINLCIWEQNLEQKILAYFNSMMAVGVSCSTSLESTTGIACPPCFLINFLKATKEEFTLKKFSHKTNWVKQQDPWPSLYHGWSKFWLSHLWIQRTTKQF
jgi:hypothetical protein